MFQLARNALPAMQQLAGVQLATAAMMRQYSQFALDNVNFVKAGPGGRSSVSGVTATIFGANGFVGTYVANEVTKRGSQIVCPFRSTENDVQPLKQMGDLGQVVLLPEFDIRDEDAIKHAISRSNVVINCIGMRNETKNFTYKDVHIDFPTRLSKLVAKAGHVERFIHFSDMAADVNHPSKRLASKAVGDKAVMQNFPDATIMRPGSIVGIEDHFYNYLIYQLGLSMFAPIIENGVNKIQPTYVIDVAEACVAALKTHESKGKTYYLGGPEVLTMRQMYDILIKTLRLKTDDTVPTPAWAAKMLFKPLDKFRSKAPKLPMTSYMQSVDYVEEQLIDSVVPANALSYADLGIIPQKVTDGLPLEPVRHYRVGGYRWGDMQNVAKDVPANIKKYYNLK